jgi:membrane associated rhomboid family serine protease
VLGTLITLLVVGWIALKVIDDDQRVHLLEKVRAIVSRVIQEMKTPPESKPFDDFLRARTRLVVVTPALVALNTLVFILMLFGAGSFSDPQTLVGWGANFAPSTTNGQWWRVFSAMFVHAGLLHFLVTLAGLAPLGFLLERAVGPVAFATVYVASGIFANMVTLWTAPALSVNFGASGAISGMYGLLVATAGWSVVNRPETMIALATLKRIGVAWGVFFVYNAMTDHMIGTSEFAAFTAGIVSGLVLTRGVAREMTSPRRAAVVMAVTLMIAVVTARPVRGIVDVRAEIDGVVKLEERTAAAYDAEVSRFRKGTVELADLVDLIDQSIGPDVQKMRTRLDALRGVPAEHTKVVEAAKEYLKLREQSWRERGEALIESDTNGLRDADRTEQAALRAFERIKPAS